MGAVRDNLVVTLDEVKTWLRLDDDLEATLTEPSPSNSLTHKVSSLAGLRSGRWVTVGASDAKIVHIDYQESILVLDRVVYAGVLGAGTPVTYHHSNTILMNAVEAAKALADQYLGNPFTKVRFIDGEPIVYVDIPPEVKSWVLRYAAYLYNAPEVGLVSDSMREAGSTRYDNKFEVLVEPIRHLRRVPL